MPLTFGSFRIKNIAPSRGNNLVLLQMAAQNAISAMEEKHLNSKQDLRVLAVLDELGKRLNIKTPYRIELIDNSHYQGDAAVSAVVVLSMVYLLKDSIGNIRLIMKKPVMMPPVCMRLSIGVITAC